MKKKILFIFIIMTMVFIPSYKVEAKTLGQLKNELANLEKKYSDNQNKKELNANEIKAVNNEHKFYNNEWYKEIIIEEWKLC